MNIMELRAGRNDALASLRQQRAEATQNIIGGIGQTVTSGLSLANQLGAFTPKNPGLSQVDTTASPELLDTSTSASIPNNLQKVEIPGLPSSYYDDTGTSETRGLSDIERYQKLVDFKVLPDFKSPFPKKR